MKAFVIVILCSQLQLAVSAQSTPNSLKISDTKTSHLVCP